MSHLLSAKRINKKYRKLDGKLFVLPLRQKCPYSEFFWSVFSRIRAEYGEIRSISLYSVLIRENTEEKNSEYTVYFTIYIILQSVSCQCSHLFRFFPLFYSGCIWNTLKHWYEMVESKKYYPERGKSLPISESYWMWRLNYINTSVLHPPLAKEQNTHPNTACIIQRKMSE